MGVGTTLRTMARLFADLRARPAFLLLPAVSLASVAGGWFGGWGRWRTAPDGVGWLVPGDSDLLTVAVAPLLSAATAVLATAISVAFAWGMLTPAGTLGDALRATRGRLRTIAGFAAVSVAVSAAERALAWGLGSAGGVIGSVLSLSLGIIAFYMSPVIAMEPRDLAGSFRRSAQLVRRSAGAMLGSGLVLWGAATVVAVVLVCVLLALLDPRDPRGGGFSGREIAALLVASPLALAVVLAMELWTLALYRTHTPSPAAPQPVHPPRAAVRRRPKRR